MNSIFKNYQKMKTSNKIVIVVVALVLIWVSFRVWMIFDGVHDLNQDKESVFLEKIKTTERVDEAHSFVIRADGNVEANLSSEGLMLMISGNREYAEVTTKNMDSTLFVTITNADTIDYKRFYLDYSLMFAKSIGMYTSSGNCMLNQRLELNVDHCKTDNLTIDATNITWLTIENSRFDELNIVSDSSECPITIYLTDSNIIEKLYVDLVRPGKLVLETSGKDSTSLKTSERMKLIVPINKQDEIP